MRISALKLVNFKSYRNQVFDFPPPRQNKNLILIGGLNGFGKTSFLEALYLGLYGSEAMNYLGRAGLKLDRNATYSKFLTRAFNGNADADSPMSISVEFVDRYNDGFSITRTWYFDKNRSWYDEDMQIYSVENGVRKKSQKSNLLPEILEQNFVAPHLAPFFFFDGEEVKSLASKDKVEQVKTAIDNFLGIVVLRQLQKRLRDYQNNRRRGISQVEESHLNALATSIQELEERIGDLQGQESELVEQQERIDQEWLAIQDRMVTLGGTDGSIASISALATEINEHEKRLQQARSELNELLSLKLSLNLISRHTVQSFLEQVRREQATRKWKYECDALRPQREKFLSCFFSFDAYSPPLMALQKEQLHNAICSAWESLFSPPPANCTSRCLHSYLSDEMLAHVHDQYERSRVGSREIAEKLEEIDLLERRLNSWRMQMAKLEGLDSSGELVNRLKQQMKEITSRRDTCLTNLATVRNHLSADQAELENVKASYARENSRYLENEPTNSLLHRAEKIYQFIDVLIPRLYKLKMHQLENEMTHVFRELSHKRQVSRITLEKDATARLWGRDGQELDFDKSAGESQIFATTLLAALANISGADAPLVVDTPLGRLDSLHRENILRFWTRDSDRQVILLSQDEEIDATQYQRLKPSILKSYLLVHRDMGNGIGQTTAHEGYFGEDNGHAVRYE
ncbi:MAG: DNA sulfur modification protein DndD [Desulfovibrio sp.]|nr:DNA sulfur modification protein DndD [Desulfovibrio sp.]